MSIIQQLIIIIPILLIAISVHESMHALVALKLGDDTASEEGRITLNPLSHIDPFTTVLLPVITFLYFGFAFGAAKPVMVNTARIKYEEFGMALVAIAGPLSNLLMAIGAGVALSILGPVDGSILYTFLKYFIIFNIGFFVFNLIPFPPLDGSRVFYAFAPRPIQQLMEQIEAFGFASFILFLFLLFPFISPIIQFLNKSLIERLI